MSFLTIKFFAKKNKGDEMNQTKNCIRAVAFLALATGLLLPEKSFAVTIDGGGGSTVSTNSSTPETTNVKAKSPASRPASAPTPDELAARVFDHFTGLVKKLGEDGSTKTLPDFRTFNTVVAYLVSIHKKTSPEDWQIMRSHQIEGAIFNAMGILGVLIICLILRSEAAKNFRNANRFGNIGQKHFFYITVLMTITTTTIGCLAVWIFSQSAKVLINPDYYVVLEILNKITAQK